MVNQASHVPPRRRASWALAAAALLSIAAPVWAQSVSAPLTTNLLAGTAGQRQATDGTGTAARFFSPAGIAVDASGNLIVADTSNNLFRKITPAGVVTTFAGSPIDPNSRPINIGSADGTGGAASFHIGDFTSTGDTYDPPLFTIVGANTLGVDSSGNIYFPDTLSNTIRKISSGGVVTTVAGSPNAEGSADGTGNQARFLVPAGVGVDRSGNVYIADSGNNTIRKMTPGGVVTTFVGVARTYGDTDGSTTAARFNNPSGVAVDANGNVFVTDTGNHTIRKITPSGVVSTLAGSPGNSGAVDGSGAQARFNGPTGIAVDASGNLYVADTGNHTIRKVSPAGTVATVAGTAGVAGSTEGTGTSAQFTHPYGIAVDASGTVYIADTDNNTIRRGVAATSSGSLQITSVPPAKVQVNTGATVTLKIAATGTPAPSFQWYKDGEAVSGANTGTLSLTTAGNYSVVVTSGSVTFTSSATQVQVFPLSVTVPSVTLISQPTDRTVNVGQSVTFAVEATSSQPLTYQWTKNGSLVVGATSSVLTIASAQANDAGVYVATVTDGSSTVSTSGATLTVNSTAPGVLPVITTQPASKTAAAGTSVTFTTAATGTPAPTFQWQKNGTALTNGANVSGATSTTLTLSNLVPADAGSYTVVATNSVGSVVSTAATLTIDSTPPPPPPPTGPTAWLVNLSVRTTMVAGQDPLIVGVTTNDSKDILVRAVGPGLATYGVTGVLVDPSIQLYPLGSSTAVAANNDWNASLATVFPSVGAFALTAGSKDAALVQSIKGPYSAWELATGAGTVLVEAYDTNPNTPATRLTNVSARNRVGTGGDILIAGFAVQGTGSKKLLIRAVGPKLADYGVSGTLADPKLEIYQGSTLVASNDNWDSSLTATFDAVGAFRLPAGSKDAALVVELAAGTPPQTYTAQVKGADGGTGVALIEVYEVP